MNINSRLIITTYTYNNGTIACKGVLDNIINLKCSMKWGDYGTIEFTVPYTANYEDICTADFVVVSCLSGANTAYLINTIMRSVDKSGETLVVSGEELKAITTRRVELNNPDYSGLNASQAMVKTITDNITDPSISGRKIVGTVLNSATVTGDYTAPKQFDVCSNTLRTICSECNCDFKAYLTNISGTTNYKINWRIDNPVNRTASQRTITPLLLTLKNDTCDMAGCTFAKHTLATTAVVGYGPEDSRVRRIYQPVTVTGLNRYEIFVEGGSDATASEADSKGQESLKQYSDDTIIKVRASMHLLSGLFTDYNLGDFGSFIDTGINKNIQLTAINLTFTNGTISADYTFGQDRESIKDCLRRLTQSSRNKK